MKKKILLLLAVVLVFSFTGCQKEENVESTVQTSGEKTESENKTDAAEPDSETEETSQVAVSGKDDTGIFPEGEDVREVSMGTMLNGTVTPVCTVKLPADCMIVAGGFDQTGKEDEMILNGDLLKAYWDRGILDGAHMYSIIAGIEDIDIQYNIYTSEVGSIEDERAYAPDGAEVGTEDMPGYGYAIEETSGVAYPVQFMLAIQLNADVMIQVGYDGPLIETLSVQELSEKLYGLVTPLV